MGLGLYCWHLVCFESSSLTSSSVCVLKGQTEYHKASRVSSHHPFSCMTPLSEQSPLLALGPVRVYGISQKGSLKASHMSIWGLCKVSTGGCQWELAKRPILTQAQDRYLLQYIHVTGRKKQTDNDLQWHSLKPQAFWSCQQLWLWGL